MILGPGFSVFLGLFGFPVCRSIIHLPNNCSVNPTCSIENDVKDFNLIGFNDQFSKYHLRLWWDDPGLSRRYFALSSHDRFHPTINIRKLNLVPTRKDRFTWHLFRFVCNFFEFFLIKLQTWRPAKRVQHRCFPVNIAKFLRTHFLQNTFGGCFCKMMKFYKDIC